MDVIDEKGRLFGVINVVDALVVLVVLAMVVAGIALVTGGSEDDQAEPEPEPLPTRYATVSFDVPLESDGATLRTNDTLNAVGGGDTFTVTDVYRSFTPAGDAHVVAKIGYEGQLTVDGTTVFGGDSVELRTDSYQVTADVLGVNRTDATVPTTSRRVVLTTNVSRSVGNAIEVGDTATIGDTEVATVTAVDRRETASGAEVILVGAELTAWDRETVPAFDGTPLRIGNRVTLVTDRVTIPGRIAAVGTDDPADVESG